MTAVLLDTHAWVWAFRDSALLSETARSAIATADAVHVSPVSVLEIAQKVRLGKWAEMEPFVDELPATLRNQGVIVSSLTPEIALHAGLRDWDHRDPFDRLLASTAEVMGLAFVTRDPAFAALPGLRVLW